MVALGDGSTSRTTARIGEFSWVQLVPLQSALGRSRPVAEGRTLTDVSASCALRGICHPR